MPESIYRAPREAVTQRDLERWADVGAAWDEAVVADAARVADAPGFDGAGWACRVLDLCLAEAEARARAAEARRMAELLAGTEYLRSRFGT